jgi:inhibitor of cysteine peptidase
MNKMLVSVFDTESHTADAASPRYSARRSERSVARRCNMHGSYSYTFTVVALILTLSLSACGSSAAKSVAVGEKDANSTVSLRVGDALEVILQGNPTTGYQWERASGEDTILKQVGDPEFNPDSSALGSGGKVTLRFEAGAAGQTVLRLIYHRSFEPDVPPLKTFEVTVTVKDR